MTHAASRFKLGDISDTKFNALVERLLSIELNRILVKFILIFD
jgi:hypothetical protein